MKMKTKVGRGDSTPNPAAALPNNDADGNGNLSEDFRGRAAENGTLEVVRHPDSALLRLEAELLTLRASVQDIQMIMDQFLERYPPPSIHVQWRYADGEPEPVIAHFEEEIVYLWAPFGAAPREFAKIVDEVKNRQLARLRRLRAEYQDELNRVGWRSLEAVYDKISDRLEETSDKLARSLPTTGAGIAAKLRCLETIVELGTEPHDDGLDWHAQVFRGIMADAAMMSPGGAVGDGS
ncbi:MAG: hypothetical protein HQ511_14975 [Rhodospirillales bacterium]|nr:hypothetical protein [Rhodospirillales bacterium]